MYFFPSYSHTRGWQVQKHEAGRDIVVLDFLFQDPRDRLGKWAADLAQKFNIHPEKAPCTNPFATTGAAFQPYASAVVSR